MTSLDSIKSAVQNERTPNGRVETFVSKLSDTIESNKGNPAALHQLANDLNSNRSSLSQTIVGSSSDK